MTVVANTSGYRGVLTVTRPERVEERRSVTGAQCDEVVEALALTAALSIDPSATLTERPAVGRGAAAEGATTVKSSVRERAISAPSSPPRVTLGASLSVTHMVENALHLGGGLLLSVSRVDEKVLFPLEARLSGHVHSQVRRDSEPGIFTRFILARLAYCPLRFGNHYSFLLCPVSELGAVIAESRGFEGESRATRWMATIGLEAWMRARVSRRWDLWLSPALTIPLTERRFAVQPGPEVLTSTVNVAWGVSSGLGWTF